MKKLKLLITNNHQDYTGGGTYVMMFLNILKKYYDLYTDSNLEYYTSLSTPLRLDEDDIRLASSNMTFDVHLFASYWGWVQPRGKINIQIIYYPVQKNMEGWNSVFVLNEFCRSAVLNLYPNIKTHTFTPYFNKNEFYISKKKNTVINVGHYFIEPDNHSKNQHLIIEWFKTKPELDKLILHGKVTNEQYFVKCLELAEEDSRIEIKCNELHEEIRKDLSEAKYMVHAIGLNRTNPAQTEHFGLVAIEAMLSGCQPYVHNSGGCKDLPGVVVYDNLSDIVLKEPNPYELQKIGKTFNIENTEKQLLEVLNGKK